MFQLKRLIAMVLLVIPDGNHVAYNRAYKYRNKSADWMARELGV